jgi:hypothetical protein
MVLKPMAKVALDRKHLRAHLARHVEDRSISIRLQHLPDYYQLDAIRAGSGTPFLIEKRNERPGQQGSEREFARSWNSISTIR